MTADHVHRFVGSSDVCSCGTTWADLMGTVPMPPDGGAPPILRFRVGGLEFNATPISGDRFDMIQAECQHCGSTIAADERAVCSVCEGAGPDSP